MDIDGRPRSLPSLLVGEAGTGGEDAISCDIFLPMLLMGEARDLSRARTYMLSNFGLARPELGGEGVFTEGRDGRGE